MASRPRRVGSANAPGARVLHDEINKRVGGHRRGSSQQRGYTARWNRISRRLKQAHPLCEVCEFIGLAIPEPSVEVHHIIPVARGGNVIVHEDELVCCCKAHHELLERLSAAGFTDKQQILEEAARREQYKAHV